MKYGLLIQLFLFFHISLSLNATTAQVYDIKKANDLYVATSYAQAIEVYEEISKQGYESATLYYNLGNAYYRINKIAPAILNYERALRLDPSNLDIQHNLKLAKAKTVDKIVPQEKNIVEIWYNSIVFATHTNVWAYMSIIFFIVALCLVLMYMFLRVSWIRKITFFSSIIFFTFAICFFIFSYQQKKMVENQKEAIIFVPSSYVKSSPDQLGSDLFLLHEGTKIIIKHQLGSWVQITTEDGNKGWLPVSTIQKI